MAKLVSLEHFFLFVRNFDRLCAIYRRSLVDTLWTHRSVSIALPQWIHLCKLRRLKSLECSLLVSHCFDIDGLRHLHILSLIDFRQIHMCLSPDDLGLLFIHLLKFIEGQGHRILVLSITGASESLLIGICHLVLIEILHCIAIVNIIDFDIDQRVLILLGPRWHIEQLFLDRWEIQPCCPVHELLSIRHFCLRVLFLRVVGPIRRSSHTYHVWVLLLLVYAVSLHVISLDIHLLLVELFSRMSIHIPHSFLI